MQCLGNQVGEDVYQGAVGTQILCEYVFDDKQWGRKKEARCSSVLVYNVVNKAARFVLVESMAQLRGESGSRIEREGGERERESKSKRERERRAGVCLMMNSHLRARPSHKTSNRVKIPLITNEK